MTANEIRAALAGARARRRRAIKAELEAGAEIVYLLRRGDGVVPITEMHRLSGIARSVIYKKLDGGRSKRVVDGLGPSIRIEPCRMIL